MERSPLWSVSATTYRMATDDEVVIFSWIVYESREHRDAVCAKVMADPRIAGTMSNMPFDGKRMIHGGFATFLQM